MMVKVTNSILDKILRDKQEEVETLKKMLPLGHIKEYIDSNQFPVNFSGALMGDTIRLIAEIKKASPSKGMLDLDLDPVKTGVIYAENGAAAVSVITEEKHFFGNIDYLVQVKEALKSFGIPVLRKDFIFDPYQIYESRAYGADAILLIVAALEQNQLVELMNVAQSMWLQCLVEVHNEDELKIALDVGAEVIGINNRNLHTFYTTLDVTKRLAPLIPDGKIIVSESGIETKEDLGLLREYGVNSVLIGETLIKATNITMAVRKFTGFTEKD